MISDDEEGMTGLLQEESIGGNAGTKGDYSCVAANFRFKNKTGEIVVFTNSFQRRLNYNYGMFKFAVGPKFDYKIIEIYANGASDEAISVLKQSAELYNEDFGKEIDVDELIIFD
jgi:hypothetical protein